MYLTMHYLAKKWPSSTADIFSQKSFLKTQNVKIYAHLQYVNNCSAIEKSSYLENLRRMRYLTYNICPNNGQFNSWHFSHKNPSNMLISNMYINDLQKKKVQMIITCKGQWPLVSWTWVLLLKKISLTLFIVEYCCSGVL